jgi:hypothetical protein
MKTRGDYADSFYIDDHAALFALLIKQAVLAGGKGGEAAARGIVTYGKERGLRMAMRCLADGEPLTLRNYLNYGEWEDTRKWSDFRPVAFQPFQMEAVKCGWCESWKKHGLLEYGKLYCQWIDPSLVRGFNPEANFSMGEMLSQGGERCRFHFHDASFADEEDFKKDVAERARARSRRVRDFLYHTGHALSAMRRTYLLELGLPVGAKLTDAALGEYAALFGAEKADAVHREAEQDFLLV